ncbi:TonB-dependent receptor [Variovorax sp. E3]|uniref:TonB-dependent siderophore receptor n=1 Tax=Variovorax sp. E3 TaxID=1914993 RepID=UPI0018DE2A1E|nr:TonB-dependent receptor [Variovorax sp. E3]
MHRALSHRRAARNRLRPTVLTAAIALAGAAPLAAHAEAQTQPSATAAPAVAPRAYDIPAQPLGATLTRIASEGGQPISIDSGLVRGITASAVRGRYTVEQAAQQALDGSGLQLARTGSGALTVQPGASTSSTALIPGASTAAPDAAAATLSTVTISGKAPGSTTEGTGSYATESSSSSTRLNLTPKETPQSLTVVTRQRLDDQGVTNLSDMLETVSGIVVTRDGIGAESDGYWSRGFEIQNFEIDGVPTASALNYYTQNMAMYDRVEIVRGATGLISGLGNPSATINLIRKRPTLAPQASITAEAGNWNRYGGSLDVSGKLDERGKVRGRLVADYKDQKAWVERYKQDAGLLYGIAEVDIDNATLLTAGFSYQRTNATAPLRSGLPTLFPDNSPTLLPRSLNASPNWSYNNHEQSSFFTSVERELGNGWNGKAEYTYSQDKYDSVYTYLNGTLQRDGSGTSLLPVRFKGTPRQNNLDLYATGPLKLFGREHELIAGLTLSSLRDSGPTYGGWLYDYAGSPEGAIGNLFSYSGNSPAPFFQASGTTSTRTNNYAAYLTGRFHVADNLKLILGSRFIHWSRDIETGDSDGTTTLNRSKENVFVPYVGLVYTLSDQWSAYGSFTKIFNPQGSWVRDQNNNMLDPMEGRGYEVGIKGSHFGGKLNTNLAVFQLQQNNLAVWQADFPGSNVYKAEQNTTSKGVEFELNGEVAKGWQVAAGYAYTLASDADGKRINTILPRSSAKLHTSYRLQGALSGLTLGGGVSWQTAVGSASVTQGSYALVNLMARYDIDRHLSATLNVNNLFNRKYFNYSGNYSNYGARAA